MKVRWLGSIGLAAALALTACGGGSSSSGSSSSKAVSVEGTADLHFNPTTLTVPKGGTVKFQNSGGADLQHNFVVVKQGTEDSVAKAAAAAQGAVQKGGDVLVAGELIKGGDSENVRLGDLAAGTYSYICTVPGHTQNMKGTITVQ